MKTTTLIRLCATLALAPLGALADTASPQQPAAALEPSALGNAVYLGDAQAVRGALAAGVDVNMKLDASGSTMLTIAAHAGHQEIVDILLAAGADTKVRVRNPYNSNETLGLIYFATVGDLTDWVLELAKDAPAADLKDPLYLAAAARNGNARLVRLYLEAGAPAKLASPAYSCDRFPLVCAVVADSPECIRLLLEAGADPLERNESGICAISQAAALGKTKALCTLLDAGADINAHIRPGDTPGSGMRYICFLSLTQHGEHLGVMDDAGTTLPYSRLPLAGAVIGRHPGTVKLLLERGAEVDADAGAGTTSLMFVAWNIEHSDTAGQRVCRMAEILLAHGADVNARADNGMTPLHFAALFGCADLVDYLLAHGADPAATDNEGRTYLHFAALTPGFHGNQPHALLFRLLDAGADVNTKDAHGRPLLTYAIIAQDIDPYSQGNVPQGLIDRGADVNCRDDLGWTPLFYALSSHAPGYANHEAVLLDAGADPNGADIEGVTPLMYCLFTHHGETAGFDLLMSRGAKVDAVDAYGDTALHHALASGQPVHVIRAIVAAGADVNARDHDGWTPLALAVFFPRDAQSRREIVQILLDAGADPYIFAPDGRPLLEHVQNGSTLENSQSRLEGMRSRLKNGWVYVPNHSEPDKTCRFPRVCQPDEQVAALLQDSQASRPWAQACAWEPPFGGGTFVSCVAGGGIGLSQFAGSGVDFRKSYLAMPAPDGSGYDVLFYAASNGNGPFLRMKDGAVEYAYYARSLDEPEVITYTLDAEGAAQWRQDAADRLDRGATGNPLALTAQTLEDLAAAAYPFHFPATEDGTFLMVPQFKLSGARSGADAFCYDIFLRTVGRRPYQPIASVHSSKPVRRISANGTTLTLTAEDGSTCTITLSGK